MCDSLEKKCKRSFSKAWLHDNRYKTWIQKVPSDDSLYHCIICNKDFSCNTRISKHADSLCHKNNIKEPLVLSNDDNNDDANVSTTISKRKFRQQWLEVEQFQPWLREVSHDEKSCFCSFCGTYLSAHLSNIYHHAESATHLKIVAQNSANIKESNESTNVTNEAVLPFDEQSKIAQIRFAAFVAENSISHQTAEKMLKFFQHIGKDSKILQSISMSRTKCQKIIANVLCPVETNRVVENIQNTKFSVFIDETSDISNKKWMTFLVRYVDPETLDIRSQLVKLIDIDAKDGSAEKLFEAFRNEMWTFQIPFQNIVALSCDNASVMTGKYSSFKTKLGEKCKNLLTLSCPCHSAALVAHAACAKIPDYCEEFVKKIATYINNSPKRFAIFEEFSECFQEKHRKILKLSDTRWLARHTCIERLVEYWNTINLFLSEMVMNEKTNSGEHLLSIMQKPDVKAYLLFLKYILNYFNSFNAFFQAVDTRIQLLQPKSLQFLVIICKHFLKPELLHNVNNVDFSNKENKKSLNEVILGTECEKCLTDLTEQHADVVANVRENCLQFYVTAAQEIRKRLPISDKFLSKLKVFQPDIALRDNNREISFHDVSFVAQTISGFDENGLRKEWFALHQGFTDVEKDNLEILEFDDMWKQIFKRSHQYSNLKSLLNAIRSLPNSNADSERIFSYLPDLKTKKRNKLSCESVNATCVLKSALKTRRETAANIEITNKHLSYMSKDKLYSACPKKPKSKLTLYAADDVNEIAGPSSSIDMV